MQISSNNSLLPVNFIVPAIILFVSVVVGSYAAGVAFASGNLQLSEYFGNFFSNVPKGCVSLISSNLLPLLFLWTIIFASSFALPGLILNFMALSKRGFVLGYTAGSFFCVYGIKGMLAVISLIPEQIVFIPSLIFFSSISLKMSFLHHGNKKFFYKKYALFSIFFLTVFCAVSVFQTFLTTIFMRVISKTM